MAGRRKTWAQRTRANTPAAKVLAKAFNERPVFENRGGEMWRVWPANIQSYSNDDIAKAIARQRAIEEVDLVAELPPTAIKYAVTKGWLCRWESLLLVTEKAAAELKLPRRGGDGSAIRFAKVG